jgi:GT2 family glycosyltransferase
LRRLFDLDQSVDVFLVDDNSCDGTADAVLNLFPQVHLIAGSGDLYWNRGMYLAWNHARLGNYSYFLWLNDDVVLYEDSLIQLLACSNACEHKSIISGIIESHDGKEVLYGGTDSAKVLLTPNGSMQPITNMSGNVVLVPAAVFEELGNLDPRFHHDLGDVDYGLRAQARKIKVLTSLFAVGSCDSNNLCRVRLWGTNVWLRFKKLYTPLGSHPVMNFYFRLKHYGLINASSYFVFIHLLNAMPDACVRLLLGNKYGPK